MANYAVSLALTFDDGPSALLTPAVIDLLARFEAKATFFLLGRRAVGAECVVDKIKRCGHELACHSQDHLHAWKTRPRRILSDIDRGYVTLSRWIEPDAVFRPPYGKLTPWSIRALRRRGAPIVRWTIDSGDTWTRLPSVESVLERARRDRGGIVLMHDFDRKGPDREERSQFVLEVTRGLLELARKEQWRVCTVSDALGLNQATKRTNSVSNQVRTRLS